MKARLTLVGLSRHETWMSRRASRRQGLGRVSTVRWRPRSIRTVSWRANSGSGTRAAPKSSAVRPRERADRPAGGRGSRLRGLRPHPPGAMWLMARWGKPCQRCRPARRGPAASTPRLIVRVSADVDYGRNGSAAATLAAVRASGGLKAVFSGSASGTGRRAGEGASAKVVSPLTRQWFGGHCAAGRNRSD